MVYSLIALTVVFAFASGIVRAVSNVVMFHYDTSIFKNKSWYNPLTSSRNKWKKTGEVINGIEIVQKGKERFWGSSRWFVAFTDPWHLHELLFRLFYTAAFIGNSSLTFLISYWYGFGFIVVYVLFALSFHIFFSNVFNKK